MRKKKLTKSPWGPTAVSRMLQFDNLPSSLVPTPQNGQTHSNNLSTTTNELFECFLPFCGVGA